MMRVSQIPSYWIIHISFARICRIDAKTVSQSRGLPPPKKNCHWVRRIQQLNLPKGCRLRPPQLKKAMGPVDSWPLLLMIFLLVISKASSCHVQTFILDFLLLFTIGNRGNSQQQLSFAKRLLQLYLCRQELQEHPRRRQNTTARDLCTGSV